MSFGITVAVAVATPVLAFGGALLGHWFARRSAVELDRWRRREETMRMLRWGAEVALNVSPNKWVGMATMRALLNSELLQPEDQDLVRDVTRAIYRAHWAYPDEESR